MRKLFERVNTSLRGFWLGLRQWSGDAAYERYAECAERNGARVVVSEEEFYLQELQRKYSRPNRCC
jgi:uncharacterized short protein YbdD (DUF466 family)